MLAVRILRPSVHEDPHPVVFPSNIKTECQVPPRVAESPGGAFPSVIPNLLTWIADLTNFRGVGRRPGNGTYTVFRRHVRGSIKFLGGRGRRPRFSKRPAHGGRPVRGPGPAPPHAGTRAGPWLRDPVAAQTCTDACARRPPARQGKLRRSPHLAGKQQLPEREDARPGRRLRLPQRRAPCSERKCREAGQGSPTPGAEAGPGPPAAPPGSARLPGARGGCYGGAPRRGRRGGGGPPIGDSSSPRRRPEARPSGSAGAAPPSAGAAPSSPASARPDRSRREAGPAQPRTTAAPPSTYPSMAQTGERTARRLPGSPRAEGGSGSGGAAPGGGPAEPVHSPGGSAVEGEWETGAETRDAPAAAAPPPSPPRKRVPASPRPAPER